MLERDWQECCLYDHPIARYSSWHIGGTVHRFFRPKSLAMLQAFLTEVPEDEPLYWVGLGSNVLFPDHPLPGTMISLLKMKTVMSCIPSCDLWIVDAGVTCAAFAKQAVKKGYADAAFFAGIPGTIGGALAMNAGAFGGETWPLITGVDVIDRQGHIHHYPSSHYQYGYRQVERPAEQWFVRAYFDLKQQPHAEQPIKNLLKKRSDTQPIGTFNCGSVFRNPPGQYAAQLIESCGLKGFTIGDASVSTKHANFIINIGKATAVDTLQVIKHVQEVVQHHHGVHLQLEVCIIE